VQESSGYKTRKRDPNRSIRNVHVYNQVTTRKKYEGRLAKFFNFIDVAGGTLEDRCAAFEQKRRADPKWPASMIIEFLQSLK
jgi:hypothetical protein